MTAEEFLRSLALRAEVARVVPLNLDEDEDPAEHMTDELLVSLTPEDADEFLSLTGVRVE